VPIGTGLLHGTQPRLFPQRVSHVTERCGELTGGHVTSLLAELKSKSFTVIMSNFEFSSYLLYAEGFGKHILSSCM
jgi:hypothetical protein